jgi:hypothetical protein
VDWTVRRPRIAYWATQERKVGTKVPDREIILSDGARIRFDDTMDMLLAARFQHFNTYVFDCSLPANTEIRWAKLSSGQGFCSLYGCLQDQHPELTGPYIFLDERLRDRGMAVLVDLILIQNHGIGVVI